MNTKTMTDLVHLQLVEAMEFVRELCQVEIAGPGEIVITDEDGETHFIRLTTVEV